MSVTIYYDGDCPFCDRYARLLKLQESAGTVYLRNLREHDEARHWLEQQGFDLDEGMVVELDGRRLAGADAVHALALLSTPSGVFNRLNRVLLGSPILSSFIYPLLRAGRWLVLFLLGRTGFVAQDAGIQARTALFAQFFALFSFFHFFNYALEYGRFPPGVDLLVLLAAAVALFFRPRSARLLWLLMFTSTVSAIVQAPAHSNHTLMRNILLIGYWLSFGLTWSRTGDRQEIFRRFAPAGQGVLLVMYVFGIFHKLNSDFLNPVTSCAVALWRQMPLPLRLLDGTLVDYMTIYGTFVAEGALIVMLLSRRLRYLGICGGILFHMLLALSGYAMYITFTMLSIAMHTLFLGNEAALAIVRSEEMKVIRSRLRDPLYLLALLVLVAVMALAAANGANSLVTLLMLPVVLPFCWLVVRYGRTNESLVAGDSILSMRSVGLVTTLLLFVNCLLPYLGLKSAQAINMFANLRLEAGVSNHLIMPVPGPFHYLEKVAIIEDAGTDNVLLSYLHNGHAIVYYDLLARLETLPDNTVSFTLDGDRFDQVRASDFKDDISTVLHPRWFRKWFHFQPVMLTEPEACNV
ncbi:MAG: DCC1-like thiol-disulfide oxidoreductase family protein [Gammaproteobacteria bacterium]|nr:DUF393 domain-containing protein [Pseudomonadales bacterium]